MHGLSMPNNQMQCFHHLSRDGVAQTWSGLVRWLRSDQVRSWLGKTTHVHAKFLTFADPAVHQSCVKFIRVSSGRQRQPKHSRISCADTEVNAGCFALQHADRICPGLLVFTKMCMRMARTHFWHQNMFGDLLRALHWPFTARRFLVACSLRCLAWPCYLCFCFGYFHECCRVALSGLNLRSKMFPVPVANPWPKYLLRQGVQHHHCIMLVVNLTNCQKKGL